MEQSKIISENFICAGKPVQVANNSVEALDITTGDLYIQNRVPSGTDWKIKGKYYYQSTDVSWSEITGKPSVFPINMAEIEVDFGTFPVRSKKFTITEQSITSTSKIIATPSGSVATGRVGDDYEWDSINFTAKPNTGTFTLTGLASGLIRGKRKILYTWQ